MIAQSGWPWGFFILLAVVAVIVIVGGVLIKDRMDNRWKLDINCSYSSSRTQDSQIVHLLKINVFNSGRLPVTIVDAGVLLSDKTQYTLPRTPENVLPYKLLAGQSKAYYLDAEMLEAFLKKRGRLVRYTAGFVTDSKGIIRKKAFSQREPLVTIR